MIAAPDAQIAKASRAAQARLPPLIDKQKEKETAEMMGKLKDLGNMFLGE